MKASKLAEIIRERAKRIQAFADRDYEYAIAREFERLASDLEDEARWEDSDQ